MSQTIKSSKLPASETSDPADNASRPGQAAHNSQPLPAAVPTQTDFIDAQQFVHAVLRWFDQHGRKDLPWQQAISPYRVWVSEIMLQQTQVATVIPYFNNFMQRFPDVQSLAKASDDEVLHYWSGLGYYARARNLQKCARIICAEFDGHFPSGIEELSALPGIGRSTAGAIRSIAFQRTAAILDGNVKRVLARFHQIPGWPGGSETLGRLWQAAEYYTPAERCHHYNQAMMDLGATLCTRSKPDCPRCPLQSDCAAFRNASQPLYPGKKPRKTLPVKTSCMLLIQNPDGLTLLQKRPASGIWGGLWSLPELGTGSFEQQHFETWWLSQFGQAAPALSRTTNPAHTRRQGDLLEADEPLLWHNWPVYRHTFSHFHLDIFPIELRLAQQPQQVMESDRWLWYNPEQPASVGTAAAVSKLLQRLVTQRQRNSDAHNASLSLTSGNH